MQLRRPHGGGKLTRLVSSLLCVHGPNGPTLAHSSVNYRPGSSQPCGNSAGGAELLFLYPSSSPAQHNLSEGGAGGGQGGPAGAERCRRDSGRLGDEGNAGVGLHSTTGEWRKNGELFPSKGTYHTGFWRGGSKTTEQWLLRGLLAISEGTSVAFFDWCHRWRAVAPTLSLPHHHAGGGPTGLEWQRRNPTNILLLYLYHILPITTSSPLHTPLHTVHFSISLTDTV